ncbi:S-adenosyl-L-methionine-dependent methyltransferase [Corynascus novoguineensis]|uniref:S-adenosyl-L-methionine-dependent methyltransferase n=1 Tax=Corynascus novoguineensis TaxID=1126955 RepID=A0AAN7HCA2_9PEZI|nr:S-adenosyl-L-methionine-dependent methyltransferase [Corynascus novoguineensis]
MTSVSLPRPAEPSTSTNNETPELQLLELGPGFAVYIGAERDARFIYKEIYEDHCYDIAQLPLNPFIIDAGANIGLFTLYMKTKYPSARILAFEPVPQVFDLYRRNLALHGVPAGDVDAHCCALGSAPATSKPLTYFPNAPGNSTFVPGEKELLRKALPAEHYQRMIDRSSAGATRVDVPVERLSRFLDEYGRGLTRIDLLKIDVESWELDVLRGVDDRHWKMVRNVAVEVSELSGLRQEIEALLRAKGFLVERELAAWSYETAPTYTVLARREGPSNTET